MDDGANAYRRFLNGDDAGFVEIVRNYRDGLILYLNGFVRDIGDAEELAQETFVKIAVKKPKYAGKSSFKTYLYAVARNVALDYLKKRAGRKETPAEDSNEPSEDELNLEEAYIRDERKILTRRAIQKLKPEYRRILYLVYFENFGYKEAAIIMKKSIRSAESVAYRARLALKAELEREGFVYEEL